MAPWTQSPLLVSLLLLLLLLVTPTTLVFGYDPAKMVCLVNRERVRAGRPPVGHSAALDASSQEHSNHQARIRTMTHQDSRGRSLGTRIEQFGFGNWRGVSENVAYGYDSEEEVMQKWMESPGHRHNILGDYTHMGSAVAWSGNTPYYTQNFASDGRRHSFPVCGGGGGSAYPSTDDSAYGGDDDDDEDAYAYDDDDDESGWRRVLTRPYRTIKRVIHRWTAPKKSNQHGNGRRVVRTHRVRRPVIRHVVRKVAPRHRKVIVYRNGRPVLCDEDDSTEESSSRYD